MTGIADPSRFLGVTDWVFDLDNTLYPRRSNLFAQIDKRMTAYVSNLLGLEHGPARALQKELFRDYGTTLNGLMRRYGIDADDFLENVHDIDYSPLTPDPALSAALGRLPGRKFIFTNGSRTHAERAAGRLGVLDHFDDIFDIVAAGLTPKPARETYERFTRDHGVAGRQAAMFEDLARNLSVPKALGMTTVLIRPDETAGTAPEAWEREQGTKAEIDFVTDDLASFLAAIPESESQSGRP